jgi:predicted metal-binding membrane protein
MSLSMEAILRRDRSVVALCLALIVALAWAYLLAGAGMGMSAAEMTRMPKEMAMVRSEWSLGYALLMFVMWSVMMVAMMLPSAAPTVLLAAALNRRSRSADAPYGPTGCFVAGYLLAWAFFSLLAVSAQWGLERSGLLSDMLHVSSPLLAGALMVAAAVWQLTPVKRACLRHCRTPMRFLTERRRAGHLGAAIMGMEHGAYCLGCCVFLMVLLFVGGVMNLYWIVGLALFVLAEKLLPFGQQIALLAAVCLGLWGVALIAAAV